MGQYLTEMQLARKMKVSRNVLLDLRKQGLPFRRMRRMIRYLPEEVDAWLAANRNGQPVSDPKL